MTTNDRTHRVELAREEAGHDLKRFWSQLVDRADLELGYETARRYHRDREPSLDYLVAIAEVFGYRLEWLATGQEPMKPLTSQLEERELLKRLNTSIDIQVAQFIDTMPTDQDPTESRQLHQRRKDAVRRFAHKLMDAEVPGVQWYHREERQQLLRAAWTFLVEVEEAVAAAEGALHGVDRTDHGDGDRLAKTGPEILLTGSGSRGWYATWSDRVLDLFAMRVYGLGERSDAFFDAHSPTGFPRSSSPGESE